MKEMFSFEGHEVRVVDRECEPWWVAKDVCDAIGIANNRSAVARLDADDVGKIDVVDSLGRKQQMSIINTFGIYSLIFNSDKPEAKRLKRWVTHEVLPLIRHSGARKAEKSMKVNSETGTVEFANPVFAAPSQASKDKDECIRLEVLKLASEQINTMLKSAQFLNPTGMVMNTFCAFMKLVRPDYKHPTAVDVAK